MSKFFLFLLCFLLLFQPLAFAQEGCEPYYAIPDPPLCPDGSHPELFCAGNGQPYWECMSNNPNPEEPPTTCSAPAPIQPQNFASQAITFDFLRSSFAQKFPLDLVTFEQTSSAPVQQCPVLSFMGRSMPFCSIITIVKVIKWPVIFRFVVWSLWSL